MIKKLTTGIVTASLLLALSGAALADTTPTINPTSPSTATQQGAGSAWQDQVSAWKQQIKQIREKIVAHNQQIKDTRQAVQADRDQLKASVQQEKDLRQSVVAQAKQVQPLYKQAMANKDAAKLTQVAPLKESAKSEHQAISQLGQQRRGLFTQLRAAIGQGNTDQAKSILTQIKEITQAMTTHLHSLGSTLSNMLSTLR